VWVSLRAYIGTLYLHPELHYVLYLIFFARVMVGLASPPLEAGAWLAVGRRPLGRRLPPQEPLRVCPRRRDRAEHEACLPLRELHARALLPMLPPHSWALGFSTQLGDNAKMNLSK
jgi:hypothetical protein